MGAAFIRGLQGDDDDFRTDVAATAKHFAGYGNSPADLALFRDEVLPPHEAAVFAARVSSVMPGYHSYRGEPASCSTVLLRQILRGEWAYDGAIVADYGAIGQITAVGGAAGGFGILGTRFQATDLEVGRIAGITTSANANGRDAMSEAKVYAGSLGPIKAKVHGGLDGNGIVGKRGKRCF
jgi:beta-glucosidase